VVPVLRSNYRNAAEILELASRVVADDSFFDLEGDISQGMHQLEVRRRALVTQILDTRATLDIAHGDMAVLAFKRADVAHYRGVLERAGIPTVELTEYDGVSTDRVKVGTFKRAKGLEFKYVLLPGLNDRSAKPWAGESDESFRERAERMRRELFVGMTRARDGLWLGYLSP
jgi:superfamily I DNA/RNA helicase